MAAADNFIVQPQICWEEWAAMHIIFFQHNSIFSDQTKMLNKNLNHLQQSNDYLQLVLSRSKHKNTIALIYTQTFIDHYIKLNNEKEGGQLNQIYYQAIGLEIVRFISQLSDMSQNKKQNQSISQMLKELHMKEYDFITEIRNQITHKNFPSKLLIKQALFYLINFLFQTYWKIQYQKIVNVELIDEKKVASFIQVILKTDDTLILYQYSDSLRVNKKNHFIEQSSASNKSQSQSLISIISENLQTYRKKIYKVLKQTAQSENFQFDVEDIKQIRKKKLHLTFLISDILRLVLVTQFYNNKVNLSIEQKNQIIKNLYTILLAIIESKKYFQRPLLQSIFMVPFVLFKFKRLESLVTINPTILEPYIKLLEPFYNNQKQLNKKNNQVKNKQSNQVSLNIENKEVLQKIKIEQKQQNIFNQFSMQEFYNFYGYQENLNQEMENQEKEKNNNNNHQQQQQLQKFTRQNKIIPVARIFLSQLGEGAITKTQLQ